MARGGEREGAGSRPAREGTGKAVPADQEAEVRTVEPLTGKQAGGQRRRDGREDGGGARAPLDSGLAPHSP